jgi:hypothetical protein
LKEKANFVAAVRFLIRTNILILGIMRFFRIFFLTVVVFSHSLLLTLTAQEKEGMVKYTPEFRFKDGIYINFDQVRLNSPIPKAKLLTSTDYNDREFFDKLLKADKIYFYDEMGIRQEFARNEIWGYSRNGILYIQIQENFNRITYVGSICHFVADITTYDSRNYNSPYGYYDPYYYSPYGYGNYYSPYGSYYSPYYPQQNMSRSEMKQYIIDFESGKMLEFDIENTELLLMKDNKLYEEYVQLSRKKKKELMFVYLRKFNENNPLYIPVK